MVNNKLSLNKCRRKLKEGNEFRVSRKASEEFQEMLDEIASELKDKIVRMAEHSGRATIQKKDVMVVKRKV